MTTAATAECGGFWGFVSGAMPWRTKITKKITQKEH